MMVIFSTVSFAAPVVPTWCLLGFKALEKCQRWKWALSTLQSCEEYLEAALAWRIPKLSFFKWVLLQGLAAFDLKKERLG